MDSAITNFESNRPIRKLPGWLLKCRSLLTLLLLSMFSLDLSAQCPAGVVPTIDGDPSEWPCVLKSTTSNIAGRAFRRDANQSDDDQWVGSKDEQLVDLWAWKKGSTNQKGDLSNGGAVLIGKRLYFFGDRTAIVGDAQIGFWFFLGGIAQTGLGGNGPASGFTGVNKPGDILAISNFINGGGAPQLTVYTRDANLALVPLGAGLVTTSLAVNTQTYAAPNTTGDAVWDTFFPNDDWTFTPKNATDQTYPAPLFFEGYIDFTNDPGAILCFNTFLLETRNSQALTASLQDFVGGQFDVTPPPPSVRNREKCFGTNTTDTIILRANCNGSGSSTAQWFTAATGGSPVNTGATLVVPAGTAPGTLTYYVSCKTNGTDCESERVQITAIILPNPVVNGSITGDNGPNDVVGGVQDNVVDIFNLNLNQSNTVNFTATGVYPAGQTGNPPITLVWTELNVSAGDNVTFTNNGSGNATFVVNSLVGLNASYTFRVVGTDAKGCAAADTVEVRFTGSAPPCGIAGDDPCPATTGAGLGTPGNFFFNNDADAAVDPIPADYTAQWSIVAGDPTKANTNLAILKAGESTTGTNVNVVTTLNCNSEFWLRIRLTSTSGLSVVDCFKRVVIADNTPPVITLCPANITIACGTAPTPANTGGPATATDACTVQVTFDDRTVENCSRKVITRTWTAQDPCGNKSTCTQLITITDAVPPQIVCPANKIGATALTCGASTLPANTGTATASDVCSNTSVIIYYKDVPQTNSSVNCVNFVRTWYAADASGNVASCDQQIQFAAPIIPLTRMADNSTPENNTAVPTVVASPTLRNGKVVTAPTIKSVTELELRAYPNPFSTRVTFQFTSPVSGPATLEVFNSVGQKLATVYKGYIQAGVTQTAEYNSKQVSKATLIYKLSVNDRTTNGKVIQLN